MPKVVVKPNESQEQLLRRFRKKVSKAGTMSLIRRRRWHVPKSEEKRIEKKKAIRRMRRRQVQRRRIS